MVGSLIPVVPLATTSVEPASIIPNGILGFFRVLSTDDQFTRASLCVRISTPFSISANIPSPPTEAMRVVAVHLELLVKNDVLGVIGSFGDNAIDFYGRQTKYGKHFLLVYFAAFPLTAERVLRKLTNVSVFCNC